VSTVTTPLNSNDLARYSRHLALREIGEEGQRKLKAARVLVVGTGGLGSPAALYLAASGIGTLGLIDFDRVDVSNLQRQVLYSSAQVGVPKTAAARERLLALNPEIEVIAHQVELRAANVLEIFRDYDIVLDGTDRFATRYLANDACVILRKPLVSAAIHRFEGQALTYVPGLGPCYRCLFSEPPADGTVPNCAEAGVLGVLPGVLGAIQATEAIKLIVGQGEPLIGRLLTYDALEMRFEEFKLERRVDCAVCGDHPSIRVPQDPPDFCSVEETNALRRLAPRELEVLLETRAANVALIDVREPAEFQAGHLKNAINVPVGQIAQRLDEFPNAATHVFICRSGARSLTAATLASRSGLRTTAQLEGGLLAWARDVDQTFVVAPVH
jgi:adenylyltransferase/sulfurtransferase